MATQRKNHDMQGAIKHWKYIASETHEPLNNADYHKLAKFLDKLLDIVGEDWNCPR